MGLITKTFKTFFSFNGHKIKPEDLPTFSFRTKPNKKKIFQKNKITAAVPPFEKVNKTPLTIKANRASKSAYAEIKREFDFFSCEEDAEVLFEIFLKTECSVARTAELTRRPIEHIHIALEPYGVNNPYRHHHEIHKTESLLA